MIFHHEDGTTEFRFLHPKASSVALVGDFNGWSQRETPMCPHGDGWWVVKGRLQPGTYRFLYHADGGWFPDYAAFGLESGPYGWNSVLEIGPRPVHNDEERAPGPFEASGKGMQNPLRPEFHAAAEAVDAACACA